MAAGDVVVTNTTNRSFGCAEFDGVDDRITITPATIIPTDGDFSVSLWLKAKPILATSSRRGTAFSISDYATSVRGCCVRIDPLLDDLTLTVGDNVTSTTTTLINDLTTINQNQWYHILITYNNTTTIYTPYINGTATGGTATKKYIYPVTDNKIYIGHSALNSAEAYWRGNICNVRVYKKILSTDEIAKLYTGIAPTSATNDLIGEWKLQKDYNDSQSNTPAHNGTNTGTFLTIVDDAITTAVKAQRVASTDKWLCARGQNGQVIVANIE